MSHQNFDSGQVIRQGRSSLKLLKPKSQRSFRLKSLILRQRKSRTEIQLSKSNSNSNRMVHKKVSLEKCVHKQDMKIDQAH